MNKIINKTINFVILHIKKFYTDIDQQAIYISVYKIFRNVTIIRSTDDFFQNQQHRYIEV